MTTQTVHIHTFDYGSSLSSATLRNVADDTFVAAADSVNEVTADSGLYAAVFGEPAVIAAGEYRLRAVVGGQPINRYVTLAGTDGEIVEARNERTAVLDASSVTAVQSGLATAVAVQSVKDDTGIVLQAQNTSIYNRIGAPAGASIAADVASVKTDTGTTIPSQISGLNNLSASQVNAEVLDVLQTDTFAELSAPPAATSSLKDKLTWLFMCFRNRSTETSTQRKLYADDATTVVSTETVSDDGATFTKGEAS